MDVEIDREGWLGVYGSTTLVGDCAFKSHDDLRRQIPTSAVLFVGICVAVGLKWVDWLMICGCFCIHGYEPLTIDHFYFAIHTI